jgi:hypothetical protein
LLTVEIDLLEHCAQPMHYSPLNMTILNFHVLATLVYVPEN